MKAILHFHGFSLKWPSEFSPACSCTAWWPTRPSYDWDPLHDSQWKLQLTVSKISKHRKYTAYHLHSHMLGYSPLPVQEHEPEDSNLHFWAGFPITRAASLQCYLKQSRIHLYSNYRSGTACYPNSASERFMCTNRWSLLLHITGAGHACCICCYLAAITFS